VSGCWPTRPARWRCRSNTADSAGLRHHAGAAGVVPVRAGGVGAVGSGEPRRGGQRGGARPDVPPPQRPPRRGRLPSHPVPHPHRNRPDPPGRPRHRPRPGPRPGLEPHRRPPRPDPGRAGPTGDLGETIVLRIDAHARCSQASAQWYGSARTPHPQAVQVLRPAAGSDAYRTRRVITVLARKVCVGAAGRCRRPSTETRTAMAARLASRHPAPGTPH
jgi:hypothetical protein